MYHVVRKRGLAGVDTKSNFDPVLEEYLAACEKASLEFHMDTSHPSDCPAYCDHYEAPCPCEREWRKYCTAQSLQMIADADINPAYQTI
jgi:hypothetical protein